MILCQGFLLLYLARNDLTVESLVSGFTEKLNSLSLQRSLQNSINPDIYANVFFIRVFKRYAFSGELSNRQLCYFGKIQLPCQLQMLEARPDREALSQGVLSQVKRLLLLVQYL